MRNVLQTIENVILTKTQVNPHPEPSPLRREKGSSKRSAFTLVELLVVIVAILFLAGTIFPSLEAIRHRSKEATCVERLKTIAVASHTYAADDADGHVIPVHPRFLMQDPSNPSFIGAYEWGGKSGIGKEDYLSGTTGNILDSKYGTAAGFGPPTRPLNAVLYPYSMADNSPQGPAGFNRVGAFADTQLEFPFVRCPADDGPPGGAHCPDWIATGGRSSYDHFGTSYAANMFMIASANIPGAGVFSNSPYFRPLSDVPAPASTMLYEENIGRWAWACRQELCDLDGVAPGVDPGPTKAVRGWHGKDWIYNWAFVDAHVQRTKIYIEGSEDADGYSEHYRNELVFPDDPASQESYRCIIVRGEGWQKDTLPSELVFTGLLHSGNGRPSYEDCVKPGEFQSKSGTSLIRGAR